MENGYLLLEDLGGFGNKCILAREVFGMNITPLDKGHDTHELFWFTLESGPKPTLLQNIAV